MGTYCWERCPSLRLLRPAVNVHTWISAAILHTGAYMNKLSKIRARVSTIPYADETSSTRVLFDGDFDLVAITSGHGLTNSAAPAHAPLWVPSVAQGNLRWRIALSCGYAYPPGCVQ